MCTKINTDLSTFTSRDLTTLYNFYNVGCTQDLITKIYNIHCGSKILKIMTWNILADIWLDEKEYKNVPLAFLNKNYRYKRNKYIINLVNADIILLQEVQHDIYERLKRDYENQYFISWHPHEIKHWADELAPNKKLISNGNLTLIRKNLLKNSNIPLQGWQSQNLKLCSNGNMAGIVILTLPNQKIVIANIHLELNDSVRIHESERLVQFLEKYKDALVIIGGDFNSNINDRVHNIYYSQNFNNLVLDSLSKRPDAITSTYYCQGEMVDHIYINSSNLKNKDGYVFDSLINKYENNKKICETHLLQVYGSDHFPVIGMVAI